MPAGHQFGLQIVKTIPDTQLYMIPVVQTCPLYFLAVQRKPQRPDEMQIGFGGDARAANIAGVPMDLRCDQNYMALECALVIIFRVLSQFYVSKVVEIVPSCA